MPDAQLFVATHTAALERAEALEDGTAAGGLAVPVDTPYALESLGEAAARAVQFGSGDLEPGDVDLAHDGLYRLPPFWCEVLAELGRSEDTELVGEVATAWAAEEDLDDDAAATVAAVTELAQQAEDGGLDVYLWIP